MSFDHASHNEALSRKLFEEGVFHDWVVTTAFYSALHYSEHQLFPFTVGPTEYQSFDAFYTAFKTNKDNRHDLRKRLVFSNIHPQAGSAYNWLKDLCWTARYYDYNISSEEAKAAIEKLDIIIGYITKPST